MDRIGLGILRELLANNGVPPGNPILKKSFRSMARGLGVDQGTIRNRMKALQEQRMLRGWYLGISPGLTGHYVIHAWVSTRDEDAKGDLITSLLSHPGVERVCDYLGPKVSCVLLAKKGIPPDESFELLDKLVASHGTLHRQGVVEVPPYRSKETDLAIIERLGRDPWMPYPALAIELGLSAKTVRRRVARLADDGAIYILPILDLKALHGLVPMELVVSYSSPEARATTNERIASHVKERLVFSNIAGPFGYFALFATNVSQVSQIERWTRQQNGVLEARVDVLQDVILNRIHYEMRMTPDEMEALKQGSRTLPTTVG